MAGQVQSVANQDAIFQTFLDKQVANIVDLMAPVHKKVKGAARVVNVNQKGRDKAVLSDVRINFKAGASNMEYPVGSVYKRERLKSVPVDQVVTYEIDRATYEDYRKGNPNTLGSMAEEIDLLMRGFLERKEFFLSGDGSGKLGVLAAGSTDTVLNLATTPTGAHAAALGVSQLKPGVLYDLYTSAGAVHEAGIEIAEGGVDYTNNTVTLTAAMAGGAGPTAAYLVPAGSWYNLPHGFSYLFAGGKTGYWEGLTVTNRQEYQTPYVNAAGNEISNAYIERALQKHALRNGTGINATFKIFASPSLISIYKTQGWNLFRFAAKDDTFNTAFKNARYEDSIFEPFPKADPDAMYGVDLSDVVYIEQTGMGPFRGADNSMLFWKKQGSAGHGKGEFYMNYGCSDNWTIDRPNMHFVARNFDVSNAVTLYNFYGTA
jgi:hypothetical protein